MHLDFRWKIYKELLQRLLLITVFFCCFFFRAMFAPACLSHEVITRKWVLFIFKRPLPCCTIFYLCADSALLCCVLAIGLMCRLKAPPCPERCTAGTAASTTTGTTRLRLKAVLCIWLTAARGHTATPPAPPSEISSQGRRWMSFSSSCTWALMCRRWPSSREWTPASYWACSAVAAKRTQTHRHYLNVKLSRVGWLVSLASLPSLIPPTTPPSSQPILPIMNFLWPPVYFTPNLSQCRDFDLVPQSLFSHLVTNTVATYHNDKAQMFATHHLNYILFCKRKYHECNPVLRMLTDVLFLCLSFHIV